MAELLCLVLLLPIIIAAVGLFQRTPTALAIVNVTGSALISAALAGIVYHIIVQGAFQYKMLYVDQLTAVLLIIVAILTFTATLFSVAYMEKDVRDGHITFAMLRRYYGLLNVLIFTMISVLVVENLGLMWVAVEATTLASAFLVAFYFNHSALEAAWKYVMVCTVGICLALLGTTLLYYAQVSASGADFQALSWLELKRIGAELDPTIVKLAFIFIFIGYGTKTGLAPMHTWLPDAHSQAPSPISALLSGGVLSCAAYAMIRNLIVVQAVLSHEFLQYLLMSFGVFSIAVAIPFILVQHDMKRLFAYSSVENMGIIILAIGMYTPMAIYGALLHLINHAIAKSTLFYMAGIISQEYQTKQIARIRGLVKTMPLVGTMFMLTILAMIGAPPFGIFISKFIIIGAAFASGRLWLGASTLLLLAGIFAGMMYYAMAMAFGKKPKYKASHVTIGKPALLAIVISLVLILVSGLYIPTWLHELLYTAAMIVIGG